MLRHRFLSGLLLASSLVIATTAMGDEVQITDQAREHFRAGVNFLQDPDGARYEEAYREFRAAYAESPSWKILGNLGLSAMKLERDGEAIDAYTKYLAEGGDKIDAAESAQITKDLQTLKASVVTLSLESDPVGATIVDERVPVRGEAIANRYGETTQKITIGVRPGHHRITAHLNGFQDAKWEFDAHPSESQSHVFKMEKVVEAPPVPSAPGGGGTSAGPAPKVPMERPVPVPVWIGVAATGALLAGGTVSGIIATGKKSDYDKKNDGTHPADATSLRNSGTTMNLIADVCFGGAVVAGAVTAVLFFGRPEVPAQQDTGRIRVSPVAGPGGGGLFVTGRF